jgi:hypothetical protein
LVSWSRNPWANFHSLSNNCGRLPISLSLGFAMGGFPPAGTAGAATAAPGPPGSQGLPGPPGPPGLGVPPDPPGALRIVVCKLLAILWNGVVAIVVVVAGGVSGHTVVVAAVAVVIVVTIFVAVCCCSWRIVVMLEWCVFAGSSLGGSVPSCVSGVPGVAGSIVICSIGDVNCCMGSLSLASSDLGRGAVGSLSDDSSTGSFSKGRLSPSKLCMLVCITPR